MNNLIRIIKRKWRTLRLRPIRVFAVHHVSDVYNPLTMWECDWTQAECLKDKLLQLKQKGYSFISMTDACEKMKHDRFRGERYIVLTADDGYKSILDFLPWLEEQQMPITLFINTKYLDGKTWSAANEEQAQSVKPDVNMLTDVCPNLYMTQEELFALTSPYISIGMHGHEHLNACEISLDVFRRNVEQCRDILQNHPRFIPYMAYPWGSRNEQSDAVLHDMHIVPVRFDGMENFEYEGYIDRLPVEDIELRGLI